MSKEFTDKMKWKMMSNSKNKKVEEFYQWMDDILDSHFGDDLCSGFQMERLDMLLKNANLPQQEKEHIDSKISSLNMRDAQKLETYLIENQYINDLDKQFKKRFGNGLQ